MKMKKLTMYYNDFKQSVSHNDFVEKLMIKGVAKKTASRRWYDYTKAYNDDGTNKVSTPIKTIKKIVPVGVLHPDDDDDKYIPDEKTPADHYKILLIQDMKRYGTKFTRTLLKKYGFNDLEINWLIDSKIIKVDDEQLTKKN